MTSRKYTNKDGVEVTAWEVVAQDMKMLDTKAESQAMAARSGGGSAGGSGDLDPENDLPF
jgi:single-stranded DNA-binding protein